MTKIMLIIFLFTFLSSGLYAQGFNPVIGTAYPFEFIEWTLNGEDQLPRMQSLLRTCTITFNLNNTMVAFSNGMYNAAYTFLPDGNCEISMRALFIRRSFFGTGSVERTLRDFLLSISMDIEGKEMTTIIRGRIK